MKRNKIWFAVFLLPTIVLFLLIYGWPIVMLFGTSFTQWTIGSPIVFNGINNYIELFTKDEDFIRSLLNTIIWIFMQSTIHVAIGVILALILSRKKFYWKFVRTSYMLPNIISSAALGMLFLCILNPQFGAVNGFIRMLGYKDFAQNWFMDGKTAFGTVTSTWLPFAAIITLLSLAEIAAIPDSIYEAAKVDGASEFKIDVYIKLPLLRNIIGTGVILAATSMLQKLDIIMMTTSGGPGNITMNLPMYIYQTALRNNDFSLANTAGVVLIVLAGVIVFAINRIFRMGKSDI